MDNMNKKEYVVRLITREEAKPFILELHYAQRLPSISYAYGLFKHNRIVGVCTIGKPASNSLCEGILGKQYKQNVFELNRLITIDGLKDNSLSYFVGQVLKDIKKYNLILVSYADTGAGHNGYIYQATNWIYTGKTKERTDKYVPGNKHSRHYTNEFSHLRKVRTSKHRYIYMACDKTHKKEYMNNLKYEIIKEYPKNKNTNYILGEKLKEKIINKNTGEVYYE